MDHQPITDSELVILRQSAAMAPLSPHEMDRILDALDDARRRLRELQEAEQWQRSRQPGGDEARQG